MAEFPTIIGKRFWDFELNELVDLDSYQVGKYSKEIRDDPRLVANAVIREVEYPIYLGQPDDHHVWNCFHGEYKFCKTVLLDFWQKASETAVMKVGDCEDSSVLYVALAGKLVGAEDVYEVIGLVKDVDTGQVLGGHGWAVCKWDDKWHLIESTLDTPPEEYPIMEDYRRPYTLDRWVYDPMVLFNWKTYLEITPLSTYLELTFKAKETRQKYEAIQLAWSKPVKPLVHAGLVSKLRWR